MYPLSYTACEVLEHDPLRLRVPGANEKSIVAVLQVAGNRYFAADLRSRVLCPCSKSERAEREYGGQQSWPVAKTALGRAFSGWANVDVLANPWTHQQGRTKGA